MNYKTRINISVISILLLISCIDLQAHSWEAPPKAAQKNNPILPSSTSISEGRNLFIGSCSDCHGGNAEGLKAKDTGLNKDTGNLKKRLQGHSDGDFFWKIQNGKGDMPSFVKDLKETQIWHVINYIKSLNGNKIKR